MSLNLSAESIHSDFPQPTIVQVHVDDSKTDDKIDATNQSPSSRRDKLTVSNNAEHHGQKIHGDNSFESGYQSDNSPTDGRPAKQSIILNHQNSDSSMRDVTMDNDTGLNQSQQNANDQKQGDKASFCARESAFLQPPVSVCDNSKDAPKRYPASGDSDVVLLRTDSTKRSDTDSILISVTDEHGQGQMVNDSHSATSTVGDRKSTCSALGEIDVEEARWLSWIEKQFQEIAGDDGEIDLPEFKKALKVKQSFFAERFFALFDQDGSGTIECTELMDGLRMLTKGTPADKLKFLFDVYDVDGSGTIDKAELKVVLSSCMDESCLELSEEHLDMLTDALMKSADEDDSGAITFDELKAELEKHPGVMENLTISAAQWMKPPEKKKKKPGASKYFTKQYIQNNLRKVMFFWWYILANIGVYFYGAYNYKMENGFIIAARGGGMALNFNCMWILVLVLRRCITYLRCTSVRNFLPLDQHLMFHKLCGWFIVLHTVIHTLAHGGNAILVCSTGAFELWEFLFTTKPGIGYIAGTAVLSGWVLDVILVVMVVCSLPFVRRGGHFQVFYWTHMLYIPFWVFTILHAPRFWHWFIVPGFIFILEKLSRSKIVKLATYGRTYIKEVRLLPSSVTHIVITRPSNMHFRPGDYVFIQIPAIAAHEWHPFTISSAPEMKGSFWLHIRSAGHWTGKLYEFFDSYDPETMNKNGVDNKAYCPIASDKVEKGEHQEHQATGKKKRVKQVSVRIYIDGPYGTPTREIFDTEHAVLVGAGIGVTPFAAILQSIMYRLKTSKKSCPKCDHSWYGDIPDNIMKLKKVDFVWVNRDQKSFEWFVQLLTQLEVEQAELGGDNRVLDMHMFMTAALSKTDMKGIGLQMALDLIHKQENRDLITGLKTKTQPGRPDWNKIFTDIKDQNRGKVKIFFCGADALGKAIKAHCAKFSFGFSKETF